MAKMPTTAIIRKKIKRFIILMIYQVGEVRSLLFQKRHNLISLVIGNQGTTLHMQANGFPLFRRKCIGRWCVMALLTIFRPELNACFVADHLACFASNEKYAK